MRAAFEAGIKVPKLCATDTLESFGSCRVCLVKNWGRRGYPSSCTTPVEAGMNVTTQSDQLAKIRRGVMELYISDHPLDCLTCPRMATVSYSRRQERWAYAMCVMGSRVKITTSLRKTRVVRISASIRPNALFARVVSAPVRNSGNICADHFGRGFDSRVSVGPETNFWSQTVSVAVPVSPPVLRLR